MNTDLIADARDICSSLKRISWVYFKRPRGGAAMPLEKFWQLGDFSVCVHHHSLSPPFAGNDSHCGSIESKNL